MNSERAPKSTKVTRNTRALARAKTLHTADMTKAMRRQRMPGRARPGFWRIIGPLLLLFGLLALDWSGFGAWGLLGVRPELLLVFACVVALHGGVAAGVLVGAVVGFLTDWGGGHLIGLSVLSYGAGAAAAGSFRTRLFADRWIIVIAAITIGTAAEQVVYMAGAYAFGHPLSVTRFLTRMLPLLIVYHLALTPFMYPLGRWLIRTADVQLPESQ